MNYAIIPLVGLAALAAWLGWRCLALRKALAKARARCQELQKDRAIRQNLQQVLDRREADIRRLRARATAYESDFHELEDRASDLSMSLFRESGLRILAEKEDGAKRLKLEQLERQLAEAKNKLKQTQERMEAREEQLQGMLKEQEERLNGKIDAQEEEINRLRTLNARRLARRTAAPDNGGLDQVTLEDILKL